ncbi:hypothetical protein ACP4OV_027746 [Aristida adscensionis]
MADDFAHGDPPAPPPPPPPRKRKLKNIIYYSALRRHCLQSFKAHLLNQDVTAQGETVNSEEYFWYDDMEASCKTPTLSLPLKSVCQNMDQFPSDADLADPTHWYNVTRRIVFDISKGPQCSACGFQGHDPYYCPSPRKWKMDASKNHSVIPHHRGSEWINVQISNTSMKLSPKPSWLLQMNIALRSGAVRYLSEEKKADLMRRFPSEDELHAVLVASDEYCSTFRSSTVSIRREEGRPHAPFPIRRRAA